MSLINKMLQDLDARKASAAERSALSPQLRGLPPKQTFAWRAPVFAVVGALAGAVAVWLALRPEAAVAPPPPVAAVPPPLTFAPAPQPAPVAVAPAPAAAIAPTEPAPAVVAAPTVPVPPTPAMPQPAEPEARREAKPAAAKPAVAAKAASSIGRDLGLNPSLKVDLSLNLPAESQRSVAAETPTGPARIDKQPHGGKTTETADAEYRKAMIEIRRGALAEGAAGLKRSLAAEPRYAPARQALLSVLVDQQQWAEAEAVSVAGLAVDPAQSGWAMILARLQVEKGELAAAAETLARHAAGAERNADYQAFHALLLHKLQRPREAAQRYQAALALRPAEGRSWYGLGLALEAAQQPQEARAAFQKAREAGNLPAELAAAIEQKLR